jgi:hypothetical protein
METSAVRPRMGARKLILFLVLPCYFPYVPHVYLESSFGDIGIEYQNVPSFRHESTETAPVAFGVDCNQLCTPLCRTKVLVTNAISGVFGRYPDQDFYRYRFSIAQGGLELPLTERDLRGFVHLR